MSFIPRLSHAAQTSKKIRQVWKSKAEHGKRVASTVPYGYKKDSADREKWLIDEPAAEVVRHIYDLCLAGRGPSQIARQLQREQVLVPSAYFESIGRKQANQPPANPYCWDNSTVARILGNRQYTGLCRELQKHHRQLQGPQNHLQPGGGTADHSKYAGAYH
jgi:hypothetical protein